MTLGSQSGWIGWLVPLASMGLLWALATLAIMALLRDVGSGARAPRNRLFGGGGTRHRRAR